MDAPRSAGWIVPLTLIVILGVGLNVLIALAPVNVQSALAIQSGILCTSGLILVCAVVALAQMIRWAARARNEEYRLYQEAKSITPLKRAAEAVERLTEDQAALIPRFMADDAQAVYVEQENELVLHFQTDQGLVPWDFIERFLMASSNLKLMPISDTSDKTPERIYAQAMTAVMIRKGWATPANGPHPAMWKMSDGRQRAARFFHVALRNGIVEQEPHNIPNLSDEE